PDKINFACCLASATASAPPIPDDAPVIHQILPSNMRLALNVSLLEYHVQQLRNASRGRMLSAGLDELSIFQNDRVSASRGLCVRLASASTPGEAHNGVLDG